MSNNPTPRETLLREMAKASHDVYFEDVWETEIGLGRQMWLKAMEAALAVAERNLGPGWISTKDRLPEKPGLKAYEQIDCLVVYKGEIKHLVWNCEHVCWDDASGDDFAYNPGEVDFWQEMPELPATPPKEPGHD